MLTLYDNPFSPLARKVRMALAFKGADFVPVDALERTQQPRLFATNPRGEVPVLVDDSLVVIDSADIVLYLEDRFPAPSLLPGSAAERARARAWQRLSDTALDAVIHDISLWTWPTHKRVDVAPPGLIEAGTRDLASLLRRIDHALATAEYLAGPLSIADFAVFPHLTSLKVLGIGLESYTNIQRWTATMRELPVVCADLDYVRRKAAEVFGAGDSPPRYEDVKVVWRGDRIEWLLANGFVAWFVSEMEGGRAVIPCQVPQLST